MFAPPTHRLLPVPDRVDPLGHARDHPIHLEEAGPVHPRRCEHVLSHVVPIRRAGRLLHHHPQQHVGHVAIPISRPRSEVARLVDEPRQQIRGLPHQVVRPVSEQRLIVLPGLLVRVISDSRGVAEHLVHRRLRGDRRALQLQVIDDRGVQPEPPASTCCNTASAVNNLVIEAVSNRISGVTGTPQV